MESDNIPKTSEMDYSTCVMDPSTTTLKGNTDLDLPDCKSLIVRKCSTGVDLPPKVNLYSENIVKEEETTENVDRGSIADLAAIKKHWEDRFESEETEKVPVKKTQKIVRHWSVKLANIPGKPHSRKDEPVPEIVNRNLENMMDINDDYNENESAIEREIRCAIEREEMLRQEQEQRQLLREKEQENQQQLSTMTTVEEHNGVQAQQMIEHYENTDKEKFKPTYHEMTEADLGHEISKKEAIKELEMQQHNNEITSSEISGDKVKSPPIHYRETVVQVEIRLQREREKQFKEQQKLANSKKVESLPVPDTTTITEVVDDNDNPTSSLQESVPVTIPTPAPPLTPTPAPTPTLTPTPAPTPTLTPTPISTPKTKPVSFKHGGESKIAQELEEAKAREEEFRQRLNEMESQKLLPDSIPLNENSRKDSIDDMESSVKSLELEDSMMSISSESDSIASLSASKTTVTSETPIEREIRLAREREEEYRRQKGYPTTEKLVTQRSLEVKTDTARLPKYNSKNKAIKGDTMKKIAASRLQQEIKKERNREVTLRESGRINTTSDERVGEQMKYKEVTEGPVKRNFVTIKKNAVVKGESTESQVDDEDTQAKSLSSSPKRNVPNFVIRTPKITTTFSFQEARSNAGSLIEQELKEMREREEELKKQREYIQNKANNNESSE